MLYEVITAPYPARNPVPDPQGARIALDHASVPEGELVQGAFRRMVVQPLHLGAKAGGILKLGGHVGP